MLTPAEVIWPLIALLAIAWVRILLVADFGEADSPPRSSDSAKHATARGGPGPAVTPGAGWTVLTAEATRTDTLIWYAAQLLDDPAARLKGGD